MKKLFAMLLALVMCLALCVPAFAVPFSEVPADKKLANDGHSTVTITKNYTLTNAGTISPAEEFTFTITRESVADAAANVTKDNMPCPTIASVSYVAGDAGKTNDMTKNVVVTLPIYESVGVYTYIIKETAGNTAGVTYFSGDIKLVVTVVNDESTGAAEGAKLVIAGVHTETSGDKTDSFDNVYSAGTLNIGKTVAGTLGDKSKYFEFTVTLTGETGKTNSSTITTNGATLSYRGENDTTNPTTVTIGEAAKFYLKHGETFTISNIPYGVTYTVEETSVTGYTATTNVVDESGTTGKIDSSSETYTITNTKDGNIDMGVTLESLPYVLALVIVAGGAAVMFARKRRVED